MCAHEHCWDEQVATENGDHAVKMKRTQEKVRWYIGKRHKREEKGQGDKGHKEKKVKK